MARSKLSINRFDAGQVDGPNPRDISNEASVKLQGLTPSQIGQLGPIGLFTINGSYNPIFGGPSCFGPALHVPLAASVLSYGHGIFQWVSSTPGLSAHYASSIDSNGMHNQTPGTHTQQHGPYTGDYNTDYMWFPIPDMPAFTTYDTGLQAMDNAMDDKGTTVYTLYAAITNTKASNKLHNYHLANADVPASTENESVHSAGNFAEGQCNGLARSSFEPVQLTLFLHEENIDNSSGTDKWVKLGNFSQCIGEASTSGTGFVGSQPANTGYDRLQFFNFGRLNMQFGNDDPESQHFSNRCNPWHRSVYTQADAGLKNYPKFSMFREFPNPMVPRSQYRAKFYQVNDTVRMYDANQEGITWFIGPVSKNLTAVSSPDLSLRTNQWVVQPAMPMAYNHEQIVSGWIDGSTNINGPDVGAGTDTSNYMMIANSIGSDIDVDGRKEYARQTVHEHAYSTTFNAFRQPGESGDAGVHQPAIFGSFINIKHKFENDDEGGWTTENGKMAYWISYTFSDNALNNEYKMESYLSGGYLRYYPGFSSSYNDAIVKLSIRLRTPEECELVPFFNKDKGESGFGTGSLVNNLLGARMTGFKLYYSFPDSEDKDKYEILEWDMEMGWRLSGAEGWSTPEGKWLYNVELPVPPTFRTFIDDNGYEPGDNIQAQYGAAVYMKSRTWIANLYKDGKKMPGAMCKSPIGQPDIFPTGNIFHPAPFDGDEIIHLEPFKDEQLMVFKERVCYVLDVSTMDEEKIVKERQTAGLLRFNQICSTPHGKVWVNPSGCWLYDGEDFTNLLQEETVWKLTLYDTWQNEMNWDNNIDDGNADIEYDAAEDSIIIIKSTKLGDDNDYDAFIYNFTTKSWSSVKSIVPNTADYPHFTNLIRDYNDNIIAMGVDTTNSTEWGDATPNGAGGTEEGTYDATAKYKTRLFQYYNPTKGSGNNIVQDGLHWITKDFTFDNLGAKKSIKAVLITYWNRNDTTDWTNVKVQYSVDGNTASLRDFSDTKSKFSDSLGEEVCYSLTSNQGLKETGTTMRTARLIPANMSQAKKLNSIQFHFTNPGGEIDGSAYGFRIDDITIIYREHTTK
jgi:hypothetical protein